MNNRLAFIGGSGLYNLNFFKNIKYLDISSSMGEPSEKIIEGSLGDNKIFFLPRHGKEHRLSPSAINYRANIDSLKKCGVTDIISLSAVGSLKENLSPGTFVIVDQFIDRTVNRIKSFFDDGIVAHVSMANPVSKELMLLSQSTLKDLQIPYRYCSISMVTDYDCWHPGHDSVDLKLVIKTLNENVDKSKLFIKMFSESYYQGIDFSNNKTSSILDTSIVTHKDSWNKDVENKLSFILKRYKEQN